MAGFQLELPTIQNWSCHHCSGCCRQHLIEITDEERERILQQRWTAADGVPESCPPVVWFAGAPWSKRYRLGHREDGGCVFLDENGLCRIHAKFGEEAKPLPCRIYPYVFHPAGKKVAVSLRYSCPSVVANKGQAVANQTLELKRISKLVVPGHVAEIPPPEIRPRNRVDWPDFMRFIDALETSLSDENIPITTRLLRTLFWVNLVEQSRFEQVRGGRLDEFLEIIRQAAESEIPEGVSELGEPSRTGRVLFRQVIAQYARKDTLADLHSGWRGRWKLLRAAIRFARGKGNLPALQEAFREVPFSLLEEPFGELPAESNELFTRYFRVKIRGIHFCGPAYYDVPFVEGIRSLVLIYPTILWLARWLAAGDGRTALTLDDISRAMAIADHHHGYSPALGMGNFRRRVRTLFRLGDVPKLCAWYSR